MTAQRPQRPGTTDPRYSHRDGGTTRMRAVPDGGPRIDQTNMYRSNSRPLWRVVTDWFNNRRNPSMNTKSSKAQAIMARRPRWSTIALLVIIVLMMLQRMADIAATKAAFDQVHKQTGAKIQYDPSFFPFGGALGWLNPFSWGLSGFELFLVIVLIVMGVALFSVMRNNRQSNHSNNPH